MTGTLVERCYVYRFFDADDRLLYVGITRDVGARFSGHRRGAEWWPEVARCEFRAFPDRAAAEYSEALAIVSEGPAHNAKRPSLAAVGELHERAASTEHASVLRIVGEAERLRLLSNDQKVRLVRLGADYAALEREADLLQERLSWALASVREGEAATAVLSARLAAAEMSARAGGPGRVAVAR